MGMFLDREKEVRLESCSSRTTVLKEIIILSTKPHNHQGCGIIFIFRATNLPQNKLCYTLCNALATVFATLIENLYSSIFINKSSANYYILLL